MSEEEKGLKIHEIVEFIAVGDVRDSRKSAPKAQWNLTEFKHIEFNEYILLALFKILESDGLLLMVDNRVAHVNQDDIKSTYYTNHYLPPIMERNILITRILQIMEYDEDYDFGYLYRCVDPLYDRRYKGYEDFKACYDDMIYHEWIIAITKIDKADPKVTMLVRMGIEGKRVKEPVKKDSLYLVLLHWATNFNTVWDAGVKIVSILFIVALVIFGPRVIRTFNSLEEKYTQDPAPPTNAKAIEKPLDTISIKKGTIPDGLDSLKMKKN